MGGLWSAGTAESTARGLTEPQQHAGYRKYLYIGRSFLLAFPDLGFRRLVRRYLKLAWGHGKGEWSLRGMNILTDCRLVIYEGWLRRWSWFTGVMVAWI